MFINCDKILSNKKLKIHLLLFVIFQLAIMGVPTGHFSRPPSVLYVQYKSSYFR